MTIRFPFSPQSIAVCDWILWIGSKWGKVGPLTFMRMKLCTGHFCLLLKNALVFHRFVWYSSKQFNKCQPSSPPVSVFFEAKASRAATASRGMLTFPRQGSELMFMEGLKHASEHQQVSCSQSFKSASAIRYL